jgi:hypothetical protein
MSIIAYLDEQLPLRTSKQYKFDDNRLTKVFFEKLYCQKIDFN